MWKLILTLIVISDSGSVSVTNTITDIGSGPVCQAIAKSLTAQEFSEHNLGGHTVFSRGQGKCFADEDSGHSRPPQITIPFPFMPR